MLGTEIAIYLIAVHMIFPSEEKYTREMVMTAEPGTSSLGENKMYHLVQRRHFPPFSGTVQVGQESSIKWQSPFLPWNFLIYCVI